MVLANLSIDNFLGPAEIGTDADGRFLFSNVVPDGEFYVCGNMASRKGRGAVPARKVEVGGRKTKVVLGDLAVGPDHRLGGRALTSDGPTDRARHPRPGLAKGAWDSLSATLDSEGRSEMAGLPTERFSLSVSPKDYRLSPRDMSLDSNYPSSSRA